MHEAEFIETVRRDAPIESEEVAAEVTLATLRTLGERITDGEAADVAEQLPRGLAEPLADAPGEADPFSLDEFTARVSDRAGVDDADVVPAARGVAAALSEAAPAELDAAREQLPTEFDVIFEPGGPIATDAFLETVSARAGVDSTDAARAATTATLRTLGERLSAGEAADLALYLPDPFAETLVESADASPTDDALDEFVRRIAEREDVERAAAKTHARAVCGTLAETAGERELDAAKKQLPDQFGVLFDPPEAEPLG